jgi:hypothetical protein
MGTADAVILSWGSFFMGEFWEKHMVNLVKIMKMGGK